MNVWVTGCRGMLGSAVCQQLQQQQIPFIGTGSDLDIANELAVESHIKDHPTITHIINCAAYTHVDNAEKEETAAAHANTKGPATLATNAASYNLHMIHFSTDYVFDGLASTPYHEEASCHPIGVYARTKHSGEQLVLKHLPTACIIRTSWLFGLNGRNFVSTMVQLMEQKEQLRVVDDQIGRPTYCIDLASAAIEMIDHPGIFHFANQGHTSWYQFALEIAKQWQALGNKLKINQIEPIPTTSYPTPAKRPAYSVFDTSKIEKMLNKQPRPWKEALADYLAQLHQQRNPL